MKLLTKITLYAVSMIVGSSLLIQLIFIYKLAIK